MRFSELTELQPKLLAFAQSIPEELDGQFRLQTFPPHTIIHQKDWCLERIGILLQGTFRVINELENGNVFMIETNHAVSFIGEVTLLAGAATTSVTIETVTDCLVAFLSVDTFDQWLKRDIDLLRHVCEHIAKKLYGSSYNRGERLFYSAKYVLLKYITQQIASQGILGKEQVVLPKTRQQISEEVGMTVKTINRTVQHFQEEGIITNHRGKISMSTQQYTAACKKLKVYISQSRNGTGEREGK